MILGNLGNTGNIGPQMKTEDQELTPSEELFLCNLETAPTIKEAALLSGMTPEKGYTSVKRLKDVIINRARDNMAGYLLKAVHTAGELLDASADTEKGELRLKASEGIMDRSGLTKHTNVDVQVDNENGIFILPAKITLEEPMTDDPLDTSD